MILIPFQFTVHSVVQQEVFQRIKEGAEFLGEALAEWPGAGHCG